MAVDPETGEVGAALASCVPVAILGEPTSTLVPIVLVPGTGAGVTQGELNLAAPERISELLGAGVEPGPVVAELTRPDFDGAASGRQYAVVTTAAVAAYTGADLAPQALDRQRSNVSVQGNLLVSDDVVTAALAAFDDARAAGADLSAALVAGLDAGSGQGGDRRCPDQTALFAQLAVALPGDDPARPSTLVTVTVDQSDGQNPVDLLADAVGEERTGLIDAGAGASGRGGVVRLVVLAGGAVLAVGGFLVFRRGLGSVRARR